MSDHTDIINEAASGPQGYEVPPSRYKVSFTDKPHAGVPIWLISMTDLMGITLTFFVLLFTMSAQNKPEAIIGTPPPPELLSPGEMNQYRGAGAGAGENDAISINKIDYNQALNLGYLKSVLENLSKDTPVLKKVRFIEDGQNKRLIITLPQDLLFEKGQAIINPAGQTAVRAVTGVLRNIPNGIEIVGHADPSLPAENTGSANWDISLSRALAVASLMTAEGYSRTLPVMGVSSGLYEQMPASMPEEQRQALSRRVDLIINLHDNTLQQRFGIGPQ